MSSWFATKKQQEAKDKAIAEKLLPFKGVKALGKPPDDINEALQTELSQKTAAKTTLQNELAAHNKKYMKKLDDKEKASNAKESHETIHNRAVEHAAMTFKAFENADEEDKRLGQELREMEVMKNELPILLGNAKAEEDAMATAWHAIEAQIAEPKAKRVLGSDSGASSELLASVLGCDTCQEMLGLSYDELLFKMTSLSNLGVEFDEVTLSSRPSLKLLHRAVIQVCFPNDIHPEVKKKLKKQPSPRSRMHEVTKGIFDDSVDEEEESKKRKADNMSAAELAAVFTPEKLQEAMTIQSSRSKRAKVIDSSESLSNTTITTIEDVSLRYNAGARPFATPARETTKSAEESEEPKEGEPTVTEEVAKEQEN